ncbi:hypothetical protein C0133_08860, partial [Moraxella catarrhalis]|nr:hypothetical protein [Moraxella catarrhalis]
VTLDEILRLAQENQVSLVYSFAVSTLFPFSADSFPFLKFRVCFIGPCTHIGCLNINTLKAQSRSWPGSVVVKFTGSALVAWVSWVRIPGADLHTAHQAMLWQHPT